MGIAIIKGKKEADKVHLNRIKRCLLEKGMSQTELADIALNSNYPFMSRIINGQKKNISLAVAVSICNALEKPIDEVFILKSSI